MEVEHPLTLAARVAAFGLPDGPASVEVPEAVWVEFLGYLIAERLTGLAAAMAAGGGLSLTETQAEELRRSHLEAMMWSLSLERALLRVVAEADAESLELVVLKGPALAHCFYPDPAMRSFSDIDLLVRTSGWRSACALLERTGFRRELPEPRPGFDERFGKAAVHADPTGLLIDLHRTLVLGPFGVWLDAPSLFERTVPFEVAGRALRRLDDTTTLLHACMHASLGWSPPLLMPVRDMMQVAAVGTIDWGRFARDAERWQLRAVVKHAFQTGRDVLRCRLPEGATAFLDVVPTRRERRALDAYVTSRRSRGGTVRATVRAVPGVRAKAAFLRDLLLPDRAFLAARSADGEGASHLKRWSTPVRWLLRRSR
jgi:hypothetical protein